MALSRKPSPIPGWHVSDDPEPDQPASENGDDSRPSEPRHQVRLQKILAASGLGSRRSCEKMIEAAAEANGRAVEGTVVWRCPPAGPAGCLEMATPPAP
ncbi:MAG: hypothetical protein IH891_07870 [Planctomycetes bacterium]|nr:hypothetical protein [Planctomycetota bacterium]